MVARFGVLALLIGCGRIGFSSGVMDAGADAPADAEQPFCVANAGAALCHDFDNADLVFPLPWDNVQTQGGTFTVDSLNATSPPSSLLTVVPAGAANNNRNYLSKLFAPSASVRLAADLLVEKSSTSGFAELLKITLLPAPTGYIEFLCAVNVQPNGNVNLEFYANPTTGTSVFPWAAIATTLSTWKRLQLEMVLGPSPTCAAYDADGALLASINGLPVTSLGEAAQIGLVDTYSATGPIVSTWQVRHDDVLITTTP